MEHLMKKYGPAAVARFSAPGNPLDVAAAKVGITFEKKRRVIRTNAAHRLMEWVKSNPSLHNKQDELMEKMFDSYFCKGNDLSQKDQLLRCVEAAGLSTEDAAAVLESDQFSDSVAAKDARNKRMGVNGVPFFMIGAQKFSGAYPPDVFEEILVDMLETNDK